MAQTNEDPRAVLITGASTGIGYACAMELDRRKFQVFAGVRTEEAGERLRKNASSLLTPVIIDVADAACISAAAATIKQQVGDRGLAGLVNNAGIGISGPLELVPIDQLRRQLEVNVVGQVAVTQAVLPLLRIAKGRIVNMGSVNGALATPYLGPYAASKFAMEAITDVLRVELRKWGIGVSIVEPGPIATPIWEKSVAAADQLSNVVSSQSLALYEPELTKVRNSVIKIAAEARPAEIVVRAVVHALSAPSPKTRYFLCYRNRFLFRGFKIVPDVFRDWIVRLIMGRLE
jgi:NAD(P)-dependent dehydrogenase (short-subunit alcohol dehydrogenase family)